MENVKFTSREFVPEDCARLPELLKKVWNVESNENYWRWRYVDPPFATSALVVETGDGEIVGFNGFWLRPVKFGEETRRPYLSVDTMVAPEYRRTQASLLIINHFRKVHSQNMLYGFPNNISHKFFNKYLGDIIELDASNPSLWALYNIGTILNTPQPFRAVLNGLSRGMHKAKIGINKVRNIEVDKDEEIDEEFDGLWDELSQEYYWIAKRDMDYLRWRYLKGPGSKYEIWKARENGKLVGYLIATTNVTPKTRRGQIVDWFLPRQRADVLGALLGAACRWCLAQNLDIVEAWLLDYPEHWKGVLKRYLFLTERNPRSILCTYVPKDDPLSSLKPAYIAEKMMVAVGDSDYLGWATLDDFTSKDRRLL
jgi:hypothetical protein